MYRQPNLTLPVNRSRSNFVELASLMRHASFKIIRLWILQKILPYMGMTAIWACQQDHFTQNLRSLFPRGLHIRFGLDWSSGFEKSCLKIMIIHMYIALGLGKTTSCGFFFSNINLLLIWSFAVFFPLNYFVTDFPFKCTGVQF